MIELHLNPEIEARLIAKAQMQGLTSQSYAERIIVEQMNDIDSSKDTIEGRLAAFEGFLERMSANSDKIPILPDEAYTRENFYRNYD